MGTNKSPGEKRRFFAATSLGKNRWYWVVWPSLKEMQTSGEPLLHIDDGYEKTKDEAVERALASAGRDAEWIAAKYAKSYHRTKAGRKKKGDIHQTAATSDSPIMQEYLYRDVRDTLSGHWDSVPHRVARKTSKYVYVEQRPYSPDKLTGSWLDREPPTFRLERRALEQQGYAFIPATADIAETEEPLFFNKPYLQRTGWDGRQLPRCMEVLKLSWPCTVTDVKKAYRKLVKDAHPDGGGSHDAFLTLQAAYEEALRLFG